ncbi:dicarboxylate/amino acid:cation symporter [Salinicoccus roseus]|uniref:Dicarboxylate/amino acid:cation symporter n=1 Tax=Salinicoccus roseus TaxID=45670 RepID=A0A0C2HJ40_9STAP|nr:dicarboxylate/amino acid:cation symporter [Salinicoccus roseus]KIH71724.1 sodium:glutamate symporter [Salinicoccus roseus]MDB0579831.1 dicarboxylate/amino acid:cation symporter [Salinicoccus roseus]
MKLLLKLIAGIVVGIGIGALYYGVDASGGMESVLAFLVRLLLTLESILGSFIFFMIPLIILFFIANGISKIGTGSGKVVGATLGTAYISTLGAGILAYLVAMMVMPRITDGGNVPEEGAGLEPFFEFEIAPLMDILTALVLAFAFGIVITITRSELMQKWFEEGKNIVEFLIEKVVIPILPFYIAGVFAGMASQGTVFDTLAVFGVVLLVAILLHWVWITIQYTIAGALLGKNPFKMIKTMMPAYFTALGTMSSAATIPVTLRQTKENGIRNRIADFVIPLCANIHLSGSTITIVSCSIAVMSVLPDYELPGFFTMLGTIMLLGVVMIAAPGVPGGAIMAASGVLMTNLGFTEAAVAFMIALYMAQDSFGTAANITGDGAVSGVIDAYERKLNR